ncbi:MAG: pyridoxal-phosphate dependent enzyme [Candidatus Limnocylindria bacterium]
MTGPTTRSTHLDGEAAEHRRTAAGRGDAASFPAGRVTRSTLEPGWRWSEQVGRAMGLELCPVPHLGYVIAGRMVVVMADGTEHRYGAGDAISVDPPHDAYVEGDETYVGIDVLPASGPTGGGRGPARSVLDTIGDTPLVELRRVVPPGSARVVVKVEGTNPTGSMKDRMALAAIDGAERRGLLAPGGTAVEYTGGSTGTSLALVCAARGYRMRIVTSDAFSIEKRDHMRALGADVVIEPSDELRITEELIKRMIERSRRIAQDEGAWWVDQLNNHDAVAGYTAMGDEIWTQTGGRVDAFVQSVGTSHSLHGAAEALRRHQPDLHVVAVEPAESPVLSAGRTGAHRIEGMGIGFVPPLWDPRAVSEIATVTSAEAHEMARRLSRDEGLFAGSSGGANVIAALRVAERLGPDATVATVLCDTGIKYLSTEVYASTPG